MLLTIIWKVGNDIRKKPLVMLLLAGEGVTMYLPGAKFENEKL